jgi:hypothetical protein
MKSQPFGGENRAASPARSVPGGLVVYRFLRRSETHFAAAAKSRPLGVMVRLETAVASSDIARA